MTDLGAPLIDMLAPKPGERVLDVGCGDGVLTKQLMDRACDVIGVDTSQAMVEAAKALGVHAHVMDGCRLPFYEEFDAVVSNAALHWMVKPDEVLCSIRRALRPGGRFVAEFGGRGNLTKVLAGLHNILRAYGCDPTAIQPWYFPTVEEYRARLEQQGFQVISIDVFPRPTELPGDITSGWRCSPSRFSFSFPARIGQNSSHECVRRCDRVWRLPMAAGRLIMSACAATPSSRPRLGSLSSDI